MLIIEDNSDVAETLATLVELLGFDAAIAPDGPSGVEKAQVWEPAAILCDIGLPGISGYEVAQHLRSEARFHAVLMVAVSGYAQYADRQRALEAGFDEHMSKPVDIDRLTALLHANLA